MIHEQAAAGIVYRSNLDDRPCVALFEQRTSVIPEGEIELLTGKPVELVQVCKEFGLVLGPRR